MHLSQRLLDSASWVGLFAGLALLVPAALVSDLGFLALPAFLLLVPSLILGFR